MKKYWRSIDEYYGKPDMEEGRAELEHKNAILGLFENDFVASKSSRRDFLKVLGFSISSAALAASCERPVHKAIPYVIQPEEIQPGRSLHFASGYFDGKEFCPIVVKTRDGRPIKIEGNRLSTFNRGGTTARVQASVLGLYDDSRLKFPSADGKEVSWEELDAAVIPELKRLDSQGKKIVLLSSTIISPATRRIITEFSKKFQHFSWIQYDAVSSSAMREAYREAFNAEIIPTLRIDKARVVAAFNADFLGSWLAPLLFIGQYADARRLDPENPKMLRHYQFESALTLTGSNADHRFMIKPSREKDALVQLYNLLAASLSRPSLPFENLEDYAGIKQLAGDLLEAGGESLVISGSNDIECQLLTIAINEMLGSRGHCVEMNNPLSIQAGSDLKMEELVQDMNQEKAGALLMLNVNPVYDYHHPEDFISGIKKTSLSLSFSGITNETSQQCNFTAPVHHFLESWDDAEITPGEHCLTQPCIHPVFNTRSFQDSLLKWSDSQLDYHSFLQEFWKENYFNGNGSFISFWNKALKEGVYSRNISGEWNPGFNSSCLEKIHETKPGPDGFEIYLLDSVQMGDGRHSNNPWLQELPDPVAKVCWENVLLVSPKDAGELGIVNGSLVEIENLFEVPALVQAGQIPGSFSLALGYGHSHYGKVADGRGVNAFTLAEVKDGFRQNYSQAVKFRLTGRETELALTQTHNSMEGRPIIREANLPEYREKRNSGNELHAIHESHHQTLYPEVEFDGFHWGLAVDLNACVGCNTCVIACQAENNIPVVGKDEVFRRRIMHWIKIDRYYSDDPENPKVSYQPVMCQHCDNAPCENVCPVSATNHSSEGLNQMAYNRCVGTKYCINNCPYRARRFNWYKYAANEEFDYNMNSDLGKMVLNPDVTVRSRGVVEKCSFCVQRIQEKKLEAKLEGRSLKDGEIQPACVQSCPAGALVFGNLNDKESRISLMYANERNYHLLEELHTLPSVGYLTRIRNEKTDKQS